MQNRFRNSLAKLLAFMILCLPLPASAEEGEPAPLNIKGVYEFYFSGLIFGRLGVEAQQTDSSYTITTDIASAGLLRLFNKHSSHSTVTGTGSDYNYPNVVYETDYHTKNKKRAVDMVFKDGAVVEEKIVPPENRATRPAVPAEQKQGAFDPLTLNLELRKKVAAAVASGKPHFSLKVFDGRRLTQVNGTIAGKETLPYAGNPKFPMVKVAVRRKLLAGFTQSELADFDPKEPTLWIYYSDDKRLIPVRLEVGFFFGKITASLARECGAGESCLFGLTD